MKDILIIEDNDSKFNTIKDILVKNFENINIDRSKSIYHSIKQIKIKEKRNEFFDLIFLDFNFPRFDEDDSYEIVKNAGLEILGQLFFIEKLDVYNDKIIITSSDDVRELLKTNGYENIPSVVCVSSFDYSKEIIMLTNKLINTSLNLYFFLC